MVSVNWIIIVAGNGSAPIRHQVITWTITETCWNTNQNTQKFYSRECIWKCKIFGHFVQALLNMANYFWNGLFGETICCIIAFLLISRGSFYFREISEIFIIVMAWIWTYHTFLCHVVIHACHDCSDGLANHQSEAVRLWMIIYIPQKPFQTWHLIGWQHSRQPIRSHVRKSLLTNKEFTMDFT